MKGGGASPLLRRPPNLVTSEIYLLMEIWPDLSYTEPEIIGVYTRAGAKAYVDNVKLRITREGQKPKKDSMVSSERITRTGYREEKDGALIWEIAHEADFIGAGTKSFLTTFRAFPVTLNQRITY